MGTVSRFDLAALIDEHAIIRFVETGAGRGDGLAYAAQFPFRTLVSCEVIADLAAFCRTRFASDPRVNVSDDPSVPFLERVCASIPFDEPILFWLDAHFPGADFGLAGYGKETDEAARLPLLHELETIHHLRPNAHDVILVDDLRIWTDAPFAHGGLPNHLRPLCPQKRDASFFGRLFGATHEVRFLYDHEGYVMMVPRVEETANV